MIIGQTVFAAGTYYNPWFPRQGDAATFACESIAVNGATLAILVQNKNMSQADSSAVTATNGTFSNINALLPGLGLSAAVWGDEDGDGNVDLMLLGQLNSGTYNATTEVYHNDACSPNLGIAKTVTPALATLGQPIRYTLSYSNSGTMASTNVVITDTVPLRPEADDCEQIRVVSISHLLSEAIRRINNEESVSSLFV